MTRTGARGNSLQADPVVQVHAGLEAHATSHASRRRVRPPHPPPILARVSVGVDVAKIAK